MKSITNEKEQTLAHQCYEQIEECIINGTFAPGKKLKVDELKKQLVAGHSPIREALSRLTTSGLVQAEENKGFRVAYISESDVNDVYQTFFDIEMLALKQALEKGDDAWESSIVAALHCLALVETKQGPIEYKTWAKRNYDFHVALISACKSPLLLHIRENVYRRFDRYCRIAFYTAHQDLTPNHEEHKKLAQAVLERNLDVVQKIMKHHIFGAQKDVIEILKKNELL